MREAILTVAGIPAVAAALFAFGWMGIVAEFLLPGKVLPGSVGGVLALLGLWSLLPEHAGIAGAVAAPLALITLGLLWLARRARRNKFSRVP